MLLSGLAAGHAKRFANRILKQLASRTAEELIQRSTPPCQRACDDSACIAADSILDDLNRHRVN